MYIEPKRSLGPCYQTEASARRLSPQGPGPSAAHRQLKRGGAAVDATAPGAPGSAVVRAADEGDGSGRARFTVADLRGLP